MKLQWYRAWAKRHDNIMVIIFLVQVVIWLSAFSIGFNTVLHGDGKSNLSGYCFLMSIIWFIVTNVFVCALTTIFEKNKNYFNKNYTQALQIYGTLHFSIPIWLVTQLICCLLIGLKFGRKILMRLFEPRYILRKSQIHRIIERMSNQEVNIFLRDEIPIKAIPAKRRVVSLFVCLCLHKDESNHNIFGVMRWHNRTLVPWPRYDCVFTFDTKNTGGISVYGKVGKTPARLEERATLILEGLDLESYPCHHFTLWLNSDDVIVINEQGIKIKR